MIPTTKPNPSGNTCLLINPPKVGGRGSGGEWTQDVEIQRRVSVEQLHHWASGYVVYIIIRVRTNIYPIQPAISFKSILHICRLISFSLFLLYTHSTALSLSACQVEGRSGWLPLQFKNKHDVVFTWSEYLTRLGPAAQCWFYFDN